jgi:hypothetical protein
VTTLADAVGRAPGLDERALADLRREVDDELEAAARSGDYRERAVAYRAIGQLRFNQKTELLRRGLDDESPAVRAPAMFACSRVAGWSAHILEQKRTGRLFRPSAHYVGPAARSLA